MKHQRNFQDQSKEIFGEIRSSPHLIYYSLGIPKRKVDTQYIIVWDVQQYP